MCACKVLLFVLIFVKMTPLLCFPVNSFLFFFFVLLSTSHLLVVYFTYSTRTSDWRCCLLGFGDVERSLFFFLYLDDLDDVGGERLLLLALIAFVVAVVVIVVKTLLMAEGTVAAAATAVKVKVGAIWVAVPIVVVVVTEVTPFKQLLLAAAKNRH